MLRQPLRPPGPRQATFDELGTPLRDVTFVVVDLETTGGSPAASAITEIGAVKVRGGEVLGEFQTLVDPETVVPPFIALLTGISDALLVGAPRLPQVLPALLEFAAGAVLVAHNAPFDLGFLRAACARTGHPWPGFDSVDTARLARRVLTRDDAPDCKLATLARLFHATTPPCHRALDDARATVDVLHGLLERLGGLGVASLEELRTYSSLVSPEQRRKRHLAEPLPSGPGVYLFRDRAGRVLYVGRSRDVRRRVRTYFTSSESRSRMAEMVAAAERVDAVPCATALEAGVRELRLIAEHDPRYNRRSRRPERAVFLKLTDEPFPRLSVVRELRDDDAPYLGPFRSRRSAEPVIDALQEALPLRRCTSRLSPRRRRPACALADIGRCGAPCDGRQSVAEYGLVAAAARTALESDPAAVVGPLRQRLGHLARQERFEDAAALRDRLAAFLRTAASTQRLTGLARVAQIVAARRRPQGGWELHVVRWGRLAGAAVSPPGASPLPTVEALVRTAEVVARPTGPLPAATAEETAQVLAWLEQPGTRLVSVDGTWCSPVRGAGAWSGWVADLRAGGAATAVLEDRRALRPLHRPAHGPVTPPVPPVGTPTPQTPPMTAAGVGATAPSA